MGVYYGMNGLWVPIGGQGGQAIDLSVITAVAGDVRQNKIFIDSSGQQITGTLMTRNSANVTSSNNVITIPAGIYDSQVQKTIGTAKSAETYTPTTSNQTISAGYYLTGTQTIKGDSNLVSGNIKSGVSIFGVSGSLESGYVFKTFSKSQFITLTVENNVTVIEIFVSDLPSTATILGFWAFIEYDRTGLGYHIFGDFSNNMSSLKWTDTNANYVCRNFSLTHSSDNVLKITCVDRLLYDDLKDRGMLNYSDWRSGGGYVVYSV